MPFGCHNIEIQFCHWVYGLQVVRNGNHLSEKHWLEEPTFDRCQKKKMLPTGERLGILECACHPQACNHKFFKDWFLDIRFICYICIGDVQHLLHFPLPWWINPWSLGLASKQAASHFSVQDCLGDNGWSFTIHTGWYNTSPQDDELH